MDDREVKTVEQIRGILEGSRELEFKGLSRTEKYEWIEEVLNRFKYFTLGKKEKGEVKAYLKRMSGFSRAQLTRLIQQQCCRGEIKETEPQRHRFPSIYTASDRDLLVETDNAHGRLSGPATIRIFERQYEIYGDARFKRLRNISSAHIYNLRQSRGYQQKAQTHAVTRSVHCDIGVRRKPEANGQPGWIRVDTVHQGDLNGKKGVYHVNLVDEVLQWEIVICVEKISERYLAEALEKAIPLFPFVIHGFHSDNGGEFINGVVAELLNKLLIEQTKSRSGRTNDNALVEGKNGSVIRKHMGYWHIEQPLAPLIDAFYREHFNGYLNFHRPCGFATVTVDEKGKRRKKYKTYQTPYERLRSLDKPQQYLREGVSFEMLDEIARQRTDNEAAARMQKAKDRLFNRLGYRKKGGKTQLPTTSRLTSISGSSLD